MIRLVLIMLWHLDEVYVKIGGEMNSLWRAVDHAGEVLETFATKTRDKGAPLASGPRPSRTRRTWPAAI